MSYRYNSRTGVNEWVNDGHAGSYYDQSPERNTAAAGGNKGVDPSMGAWGFAASGDYDPNAGFLNRDPGFANRTADEYRQKAWEADNRGGPLMDRTQDLQTRGYVTEGIGMMGQRAVGAISPAQQMAMRTGRDAQGAQLGMGLSARGGPQMGALAARNASAQMQGIGIRSRLELDRLRAQEMEANRNAVFRATTGLRGQDVSQAQNQADINMRSMAANDARNMQMQQMGLGLQQREMGGLMTQQEILQGDYEGGLQRQMQDQAHAQNMNQQWINTGVGMGLGAYQGGMTMLGGQNQQPRRRDPTNPYDPGYG